eukprot:TRINITY_DN8412_c1_g1_i3.p1 TRINITY_DN8412_c1_g1~~TRINITY_DN8412_c1_g1_i3.p1  ORF type:complete len:137 (+),score=18.06 TRINITY_DN8412_c1_g1_i3:54-464(+)
MTTTKAVVTFADCEIRVLETQQHISRFTIEIGGQLKHAKLSVLQATAAEIHRRHKELRTFYKVNILEQVLTRLDQLKLNKDASYEVTGRLLINKIYKIFDDVEKKRRALERLAGKSPSFPETAEDLSLFGLSIVIQ